MASPGATWKPKAVKFDPNIIETSFGGTQNFRPIKSSNSNSSLNSSREDSISDMDKAFYVDSPQENIGKRKVRSFPFPSLNSAQETDSPYKIMKAALKRSELKGEDSSGVTVAVRVRPFTKRELSEEEIRCVVSMKGDEATITMDSGQKLTFTYDHSLWSFDNRSPNFADQQFTYESIARPLLVKAMAGYNACLFAYGQTSSGKSYSIMGSEEEPGIIPRFGEELFDQIVQLQEQDIRINVEISFFEIYNEKIHDLLTTNSDGKLTKRLNLKVREHPVTGPYVEGLSMHVINSYEDLENWLSIGNKQRATASTGMNEKSSRSHSVFTINLTQTKTENLDGEIHDHAITSKINLIDLAGSERQSSAKTTGDRLKEGASINRSLLTLGKVISQLSDLGTCVDTKKRKVFIPYRDSVLTWLLKESLGGNSQTSMLATISPANICVDETLSTLRYASQARYIVNKARINEDPKARLIRELRAEIDKLRAMMTGSLTDDLTHASSIAEIANLKSKLSDKEYAMVEMTKSWEERLKASEEKMKEETKYLEKSGIALKINKNLPYLVNLNEDPLLSETLVYVLQQGVTKVGQASESQDLDIQLTGALIAPEHCLIHNKNGIVKIEPILDAMTYVNGNQVYDVTELQHGDRVILGGDHYFRYHHTQTQPARTRSASGNSVKDFQFAKDELIQAQNAKMEKELAEVRKATQLEMERQKRELEKEAKLKLDRCLAETKRKADEKLTLQKQDYEVKLKEMNEKLNLKDIDEKIAEEVQRQASHLKKENQHLQHEVEIYKKKIISEDVGSPMAEDDILNEIEAIKNQMNDECNRWSELRQSARKSVLTPARRRQTPYRPRTPLTKVEFDASPELSKEENESTPETEDHVFEDSRMEDSKIQTTVFQLYEVALMIREANKISEFLCKGTEFYREVIDEGSVCVRVTKPQLGISTFWSVEKLSDRLLKMREMYEGLDSEGGVDPFYDNSDTWEKDDRISSPAMVHKRLRAIRRSLSPKVTVTKKLSFSAEEQLSPLVLGEMMTTPTQKNEEQGKMTIELCQNLLQDVMESYKQKDKTIVDMVLMDLQKLQCHLSAVVLEGMDQISLADISVKLVSSFQSLADHCQCWLQTKGSAAIRSIYGEKISNLIRKVFDQMALLLQGCDSNISSMIHQSAGKLQQLLYEVAKLSGEFSLASQGHVTTCFTNQNQVSKAILTAFLSGSDLFVDKTLKGAITNVEESEFRIQTLRDYPSLNADFDIVYEQIELLTASVRVLLSTVQETQVTTETVSVKSELDSSYYGNNYKRLTELVFEVSSMSEQVRLLTQTATAVAGGKDQEIERIQRCSDSLDKITGKVVMKCTTMDNIEHDFSDLGYDDKIHTAAQEIRLSVQQLSQTIKRLVRTHPHLALLSPRASPAKWLDGPRNGRMESPVKACRNLALTNFNESR